MKHKGGLRVDKNWHCSKHNKLWDFGLHYTCCMSHCDFEFQSCQDSMKYTSHNTYTITLHISSHLENNTQIVLNGTT